MELFKVYPILTQGLEAVPRIALVERPASVRRLWAARTETTVETLRRQLRGGSITA